MTDPQGWPDVLVLVGTDHHPFDRLVRWADAWLGSRASGSVDCLVQFGTSAPPAIARGEAYLAHAELEEFVARARVVVCHGGPTTISEARHAGHRPLVVPRRPAIGEHVDDHQVRFTARLDEAGMIRLVGSQDELSLLLDRSLSDTLVPEPVHVADEVADTARRFGALVAGLLRV